MDLTLDALIMRCQGAFERPAQLCARPGCGRSGGSQPFIIITTTTGICATIKTKERHDDPEHWRHSAALPPHTGQRGHQQALRFPRRPVRVVPGTEAQIEAGPIRLVEYDKPIRLAVLGLVNRSDASSHVTTLPLGNRQ